MSARAIPAAFQAACLAAFLLTLGATGKASATETAPSPIVTVNVDNAKVMRLPERTQTVVIGNPIIADVTPQRNGVVILTGRSFGQTNLIALDASGAMLAETTISVRGAEEAATVTVQRGAEKRNTYSCTPNCQRSMQMGDSNEYFTEVSGQAEQRRSMASSNGR